MRHIILTLCVLRLLGAECVAHTIWLISNGFHTSVAVRRADLPSRVANLTGDCHGEYLVIGWGAAVYYTARKVTPIVCLRATCLPTPSALHIIPVRGPLRRRFAHSDVLRFGISREEMVAFSDFLDDAVKRHPSGAPLILGSGYFPGSVFYAGRHIFWFPVTCNVWSACALRRAGVPVNAVTSIAADSLVRQAQKHGEREQWRRIPVDTF